MFECSPVPASFFPYISTALHWCRNPGGRRDTLSESPRCWVGSRCWGDRAAGSSGDRRWLPEAVVLEQKKNRWDGRLAAVLLGRGGVAAVREGAEEWPRSPGGRSLLPSAMFGEEQGTGDSLPAALDRRSHRRPPGGGGASGRPPERSSTIAWHREWAAQLVEDRAAVCPGTGPRFFFFFLSPLSRRCHSSSFRLLSLASSVLTPRYAAAALTGSPRERGEGGSRAQSREYPPGLRGAMGVCDEWGGAESRGNGARPVEWMIMNDTCATHRSRVPRRSSGRNKRRSDNSGRRERTRPGFYFMFCVWQSSVRGCRFSVMFVYFVIKMCLNVRRFPPPSSRTYQLRYSGH